MCCLKMACFIGVAHLLDGESLVRFEANRSPEVLPSR